MARLANRVKVATATTGTGTVTLGAASSNAFCTFAEAGIANAQIVRYCIEEGTDFEIGVGTYTSSGTTLSRDTVNISKIGGTQGTTKMTLAGAATVRVIAAKEDFRLWQRQTKSANYTVVEGDYANFIEATSGTFTLTLTAAATLGAGFWFAFRNLGTGEVTYDGNASETIDGLTTFAAYPGEARLLICDGSNWNSILLSPGVATFTASGTWTKPGTGTMVFIEAWGGGGSGGKGATNAPEGGGGGGAYVSRWMPFSSVSATRTLTIGAGGAAQTVASTAGNVGGTTTVGASDVTAYGGGGGGQVATGGAGGGGGGTTGAGASGSGGTGGVAGAGGTATFGGGNGGDAGLIGGSSIYGGGGGGGGIDGAGVAATNAGGASIYGGGGGGGAADSVTGGNGGVSTFAGSGSNGAIDANTSSDGTAPGGGSGGTEGGNSGKGGDGQVRITVF